MNPASCIKLLETIRRLVEDGVNDEYLKIYCASNGWNVETDTTLNTHLDLSTAVEHALTELQKDYPDPEALERAEYERLRLKFGGDPLPEPEPPGVWVGLDWDGDSWDAEIVFTEETAAELWFADYPQHRSVSRVPYHES